MMRNRLRDDPAHSSLLFAYSERSAEREAEPSVRSRLGRPLQQLGAAIQYEARILLVTFVRLALGRDGLEIVNLRIRSREKGKRRARPKSPRRHASSPGSSDRVRSETLDRDPDSALSEALSHRDPTVRVGALDVVSTFSAERAERYLPVLMWDSDPDVRRAAVAACARLATPRTVSALILALDDPHVDVRRTAAASLQAATGKTVPDAAAEDAERRGSMVAELQAWWKQERYSQLSENVGWGDRGGRRTR